MKKILILSLIAIFALVGCKDMQAVNTSSNSESSSESSSDLSEDESSSESSSDLSESESEEEFSDRPNFMNFVEGYWHMEGGSMQYALFDDMTYVRSTATENVYGTFSVDDYDGDVTFVSEDGQIYGGLYYAVQDYLEIELYDTLFYKASGPIEFTVDTQSIDDLLLRDWVSEDDVYFARFDNLGYFAIESEKDLHTGSFIIDGLNVHLDYDFLDDSIAVYDFDNHILTIDGFGEFYWIYE